MVTKIPNIKPRNPFACSSLMKKGGAHQKSKSSLRKQYQNALNAELSDWQKELAFERELKKSITKSNDSDAFFMIH